MTSDGPLSADQPPPPPAPPTSDPPRPDPPPPGATSPDEPSPDRPGISLRLPSFRSPIHRSTTDRYLAGVAGGLGARLGVDPLFVRVGLVAATIFLGSGPYAIVPTLYLLAWLLVPTEGGRSLLVSLTDRPALQEAAGACLGWAFTLLVLSRAELLLPSVLLLAAVMLLAGPGRAVPEEATPDTFTGAGQEAAGGPAGAAGTATSPVGATGPGTAGGGELPAAQARRRALTWAQFWNRAPDRGGAAAGIERPPRREPALWPLTAALLVAFWVAFLMLDAMLEPGLRPSIAINGSLLIVGAVLVVAAWRGRAGVTLLFVVPLLPLWVAFSVFDVARHPGQGTVRMTPAAADDGELRYAHGYGELELDLRELDYPEGSEKRLRYDLTAGLVTIIVPRDVALTVESGVGIGGATMSVPAAYHLQEDYGAVTTITRRYEAIGTTCLTWQVASDGLRTQAIASGVDVDRNAEGEEVADAIAAAGFERPEYLGTEVWSDIHGSLYESDGTPIGFSPEPVPEDERLFDIDGVPVSPGEVVRVDTWSYLSDNDGALCRPEPPPDDPARLRIEGTIGLGMLEVRRV